MKSSYSISISYTFYYAWISTWIWSNRLILPSQASFIYSSVSFPFIKIYKIYKNHLFVIDLKSWFSLSYQPDNDLLVCLTLCVIDLSFYFDFYNPSLNFWIWVVWKIFSTMLFGLMTFGFFESYSLNRAWIASFLSAFWNYESTS